MALGSVNVPGALGRELKEADRALEARIASAEKTLSGMEKIPGSDPPTSQVTAQVGQIYINVITGEQWKCVSADENGTVWEKQEADEDRSGLAEELTARVESLEKTLSGLEKIPGSDPPTSQVTAQVGQIYINVVTGEQWKCVAVSDSGTAWEKLTGSGTALSAADVGAVDRKEKGKPGGVATLDETGKVQAVQLPSLCPFVAGTSAPADKAKLWIDTTAGTGGLKYWNGSAWATVPVAYS